MFFSSSEIVRDGMELLVRWLLLRRARQVMYVKSTMGPVQQIYF